MKLSVLDGLIWALSFVLNAALLTVLVARGRWRQFPVFTLWIAFQVALTVVLYVAYVTSGIGFLYSEVFWKSLWPDFALQLGVAIEIARIVLRPTGTWLRDAKGPFIATAIGGVAIAAALSWWISPPFHSALAVWRVRGNLFTSLVICEVFVATGFAANRLGLGWRNHVMAVGQGLTVWSGVMLIDNALQSYFSIHYFYEIGRFREFAYMGAILWIAVRLWKPEPERQPISEDLQEHILALHRRVEYDLRRLDAGS